MNGRAPAVLALVALIAACARPIPSVVADQTPALPTGSASAPAPPPSEHRIGVRAVDGQGQFYDRQSDTSFVPRGANLIRLGGYHQLFNSNTYDAAALEDELARLAAGGYNVVRVFHDHRSGGLGGSGSALPDAYMDNVADFLERARRHGLFVMFTQDWLPDDRYPFTSDPGIEGINSLYLAREGVEANARFFGDFVDALIERGAPLDAVWAYELRNELHFDAAQPPFNMTSGSVTAANGVTYDLADHAQHTRLLEDGLVHWIDSLRTEILERDPTALVAVGFFQPQGPNPTRPDDSRLIETGAAITASSADFIDLHGYPGGDLNLQQLVENFKLPQKTVKPVVLGEFGAFRDPYPDIGGAVEALIGWQAESCRYGFDGWLLWTWDSAGGFTETWNGTDSDGALAEALAPGNRPDPCSSAGAAPVNLALDRPVEASAELPGEPATAIIDGVLGNVWSAGADPTQWVEIDLGGAASIGEVRLTVAQHPAGPTGHRVYGRVRADDELILLHEFSGSTAEGDVLSFEASDLPLMRFVRVETVASPSWVAWHEIEVFGAR